MPCSPSVPEHVPGTLGEHGIFPVPCSLFPAPLRIPPPQIFFLQNLASGGPARRSVLRVLHYIYIYTCIYLHTYIYMYIPDNFNTSQIHLCGLPTYVCIRICEIVLTPSRDLFPVPCSLFPQDPTERTCVRVPCSLFSFLI